MRYLQLMFKLDDLRFKFGFREFIGTFSFSLFFLTIFVQTLFFQFQNWHLQFEVEIFNLYYANIEIICLEINNTVKLPLTDTSDV